MKLTFNFQTLILLTLTSVLIVATAIWGAVVYQSIYDIILRGFDQKLLALSGAAAEFTDGDGHARYQEPRQILALTGASKQLLGFDATRGELVSIDPADGGALAFSGDAVNAAAADTGIVAPRSIAADLATGRIALLSGDGLGVALLPTQINPTQLLDTPADGLLFVDGMLAVRRDQTLSVLGAAEPLVQLAEAVTLLSPAPPPASFVGLARADAALIWFAADGRVQHRLNLDWAAHEVTGIAYVDEQLYATAATLLRVDLASGALVEDFAPGFYSERDPFFARYAPLYQRTREAAGLTYLYTDVHLGEDQIRYVLDGSVGDDHSPPGTLDVLPEDSINDVTLAQSRGQAFVSAIREWDEWGLIKIAAEPIYGSNGKVVALAGADVDIGVIREKTRFALFAVIFVGAVLLLLAGSVSYRVSQSLMRPLRNIKDSALRIAAGYHGTRVDYGSSDEIGQLAQSLNALSSRLAAQARQSQAYQDALTNGREQIALEHALGDLLLRKSANLPGGLSCAAAPLAQGAACGYGQYGMLWKLRGAAEALDACVENARVQSQALVLLAHHAESAVDTLFLTMPSIAAVACWDAKAHCLTLRCRGALSLQLRNADGTRSSLQGFDGMQITLTAGQSLAWGEGQILNGPAATLGAA